MESDVVVIVDTSTSMSERGMDPERASLLVTKLLTDIVPGELAVARLLDLQQDKDKLPRTRTGETVPCAEDPTRECQVVEPTEDWSELARRELYGIAVRPRISDPGFKRRLESHLAQTSNNSTFGFAFSAAMGVFDRHLADGLDLPRTIIWLSDGRADSPDLVQREVRKADQMARVEAILFGRGEEELARSLGLEVRRGSTPGELMKAFAGAFRTVMRAPYEIDAEIALQPRFDMKEHIDEAWVVIYGDPTLESAWVDSPEGRRIAADYAADHWPTAGAYRVAHLDSPESGPWSVSADGGGPGVAYAVVQRSALAPRLLSPESTLAEVEVLLEVGVRVGRGGELLTDPELLSEMELQAFVENRSYRLRDDGAGGDRQAGDGIFSALHAFREIGDVPVRLHLLGELVDRSVTEHVEVDGYFRFLNETVEIDLGSLGVADEACRPLAYDAEHRGRVPLRLLEVRSPPAGHQLRVEGRSATWTPDGEARDLTASDRLQICLATGERVASSKAEGERWLELQVAGGTVDGSAGAQTLAVHLRWEVEGLSFWERWGKWILLLLAILFVTFVVLGFVLPKRFSPSLALAFAPEREELDELTPQPVRQWRGVGIGFYRDARAYLQPDYRISGKARGSVAEIRARSSRNVLVKPTGSGLWRETIDGDWEAVSRDGTPGRSGHVFRVGAHGPYFRISTRRGRS